MFQLRDIIHESIGNLESDDIEENLKIAVSGY